MVNMLSIICKCTGTYIAMTQKPALMMEEGEFISRLGAVHFRA